MQFSSFKQFYTIIAAVGAVGTMMFHVIDMKRTQETIASDLSQLTNEVATQELKNEETRILANELRAVLYDRSERVAETL